MYSNANFHQHKPLGDLLRERPVCLKAEADQCPDNDGSIYVFFWLLPFLRTSTGVGWSMDFPVSVKTFLVEPSKEMNETGELRLPVLPRNFGMWKHVTRSYSHNK